MPASTLKALLIPVWMGEWPLTPAHRALKATNDKSEHIADVFPIKQHLVKEVLSGKNNGLLYALSSTQQRNKARWTNV